MPEVEFALIYASLTAQIAGDSNLRILRIRTVVSAKKKMLGKEQIANKLTEFAMGQC